MPPAATSRSILSCSRVYPVTWYPALTRFSDMGEPMMPRPIQATLGRLLLMRVPSGKRVCVEGAGLSGRGRASAGSQSNASALGRSPGLYSRPTQPS